MSGDKEDLKKYSYYFEWVTDKGMQYREKREDADSDDCADMMMNACDEQVNTIHYNIHHYGVSNLNSQAFDGLSDELMKTGLSDDRSLEQLRYSLPDQCVLANAYQICISGNNRTRTDNMMMETMFPQSESPVDGMEETSLEETEQSVDSDEGGLYQIGDNQRMDEEDIRKELDMAYDGGYQSDVESLNFEFDTQNELNVYLAKLIARDASMKNESSDDSHDYGTHKLKRKLPQRKDLICKTKCCSSSSPLMFYDEMPIKMNDCDLPVRKIAIANRKFTECNDNNAP